MMRRRLIWALLSTAAFFFIAELGARYGLGLIAPETASTFESWVAGPPLPPAARFAANPDYFYAYDPAEPGVNEAGFLGPIPVDRVAGGGMVVAFLGDSTVAGEHGITKLTGDLLRLKLGRQVQTYQAAVPGWSLREVRLAAEVLLPSLRPDAVVVQAGANDLGAAMAGEPQNDYSHWRQPDFGDKQGVYRQLKQRRRLFSVSRLAALFAYAGGTRPPSPPRLDALANRADTAPHKPQFGAAFVGVLEYQIDGIIAAAKRADTKVFLVTQPICLERIGDVEHRRVVRDGMAVVTKTLRRARAGATLIDLAAQLEEPCEAMVDGIHAGPAGDAAKAERIAAALVAGLENKDAEE
jgi:lysophospholipase L1-like esterase